MTPILIFLVLTVAAFVLMALEVFLPGGVVGALGGICLLVACVFAIKAFGSANGIVVSLLLILSTLGAFMFWLVKLPGSRMGKRIVLQADLQGSKSAVDENHLVGLRGLAETDLRPSGYIRIDGKRHDVVAARGFIQQGTEVEVSEVHGMRIVVREITPAEVT
jgi:membrane-bound serine protease (ClpP class)